MSTADVPLPAAHADNPGWQKLLAQPCPHGGTLGECPEPWCAGRREDFAEHGGKLPDDAPAETLAEARTTAALSGFCYDCRARPYVGWSAYCVVCGPKHTHEGKRKHASQPE